MDNKMFEANMGALDILYNCFDSLKKEWKWYNPFRYGRIVDGMEKLINSCNYLLNQSEVILSIEDN